MAQYQTKCEFLVTTYEWGSLALYDYRHAWMVDYDVVNRQGVIRDLKITIQDGPEAALGEHQQLALGFELNDDNPLVLCEESVAMNPADGGIRILYASQNDCDLGYAIGRTFGIGSNGPELWAKVLVGCCS